MSRIRIALTFVAALALYALVVPISAFAATPTTIEVSNSSEFDNAVATINAATSGEYIIELTDDIQTGGASFSSSQPVSIVGNGQSAAETNRATTYLVCCISKARAICTPALPLPTVKAITTLAAA